MGDLAKQFAQRLPLMMIGEPWGVLRTPDVLDLGRSPVYHMAFGQDIHHWIGAPLARMESRIAFEEFFTRVPNYEIVGSLTRLFTRREQRGIASLPGRLETGSR